MQYLKEINGFYDWLETNQLSSNAINLWHALMNVANKASWKYRFAVAISTLEVKTGLQRRTIERARNELFQKGRIEWKKRNGNQSAEYHLISLYDTSDAQSVVQVDAQSVVQVDAINRLDKTRIYISNGESKIISESLVSVMNDFLSDRIYLETLCMNNSIHDENEMSDFVKLFFVKYENESADIDDMKELKRHFANWLRIQIENKSKNQKGGKNGSAKFTRCSESDKTGRKKDYSAGF